MTEVSREVCGDLIKESETRMMAYSESHVEKKIDTLADGLLATNARIDRLPERIDDMNETFLANTMYIVKDARDKGQAKALWICSFLSTFPIQAQSSQQFFTLLGAIFYAYLVDKGMSEMDAPESEKEQLTLAGHLDRPFPF